RRRLPRGRGKSPSLREKRPGAAAEISTQRRRREENRCEGDYHRSGRALGVAGCNLQFG
ncbi:unnamed protein product, partial [Durusdinium trenchii]